MRAALEWLRDEMSQQFGPYPKRAAALTYLRWVEGAGARVRGSGGGAAVPAARTDDAAAAAAAAGGEFSRAASRSATPRRCQRAEPPPPRDSPAAVGAGAASRSGSAATTPAGAAAARRGVARVQEVWPLHLIEWDNAGQMDVLFRLLRCQPEVIRYYLTGCATPGATSGAPPKGGAPRGVFPRTMQFQSQKVGASGQEIGSDLLFGRRMGFSGTPNNLLPEELGPCDYAPLTDGAMLHVLTSPSVVGESQALQAQAVQAD